MRAASRVIRSTLPLRRLFSTGVPGREAMLFTPGPLTTSMPVKAAMLRDLGSRDKAMIAVVQDIRDRLLDMAGVSKSTGYECILQQGSGTFAVESVVGSMVPPPSKGGRILVVANGSYGVRMAKICEQAGIDHGLLQYDERCAPTAAEVVQRLREDGDGGRPYTHVGIVHHETTVGMLNPVEAIGSAIRDFDSKITFIVDSMSGFGAYPLDMRAANVHFLVSSPNKNVEGVPGFGFALCDRERLLSQGINARSVSMDLLEQWRFMEESGQFRFTPPTHTLLAFQQALLEHEAEGGVPGRLARYQTNFEALKEGMASMGFHPYLDADKQSVIISTYLYPDDPNFNFQKFYDGLSDRGLVIYPGKLAHAPCFRVGSIGRLFPKDFAFLLAGMREILLEMGVSLPVKQVELRQ